MEKNDIDFEKPFRPFASIDYVDGGIAKQKVGEDGAGGFTLYALDEGQSLPETTATGKTLLQTVEAWAVVTVDGNEHILENGMCLLVPAGSRYAIRADVRFKMLIAEMRG